MFGPQEITLLVTIYGFYYLFLAIGWYKIFSKAGLNGWKAFIPIYNLYVFTKIVEKPGYWTLLYCIPYVNYVFGIWSFNLLSKKFGKDSGFTVGLVLLNPIFVYILAFSKAQFQSQDEITESDVLDEAF